MWFDDSPMSFMVISRRTAERSGSVPGALLASWPDISVRHQEIWVGWGWAWKVRRKFQGKPWALSSHLCGFCVGCLFDRTIFWAIQGRAKSERDDFFRSSMPTLVPSGSIGQTFRAMLQSCCHRKVDWDLMLQCRFFVFRNCHGRWALGEFRCFTLPPFDEINLFLVESSLWIISVVATIRRYQSSSSSSSSSSASSLLLSLWLLLICIYI